MHRPVSGTGVGAAVADDDGAGCCTTGVGVGVGVGVATGVAEATWACVAALEPVALATALPWLVDATGALGAPNWDAAGATDDADAVAE